MLRIKSLFVSLLVVSSAQAGLAAPTNRGNSQERLDNLEQQLRDVQKQLHQIKVKQDDNTALRLTELKLTTQKQYEELNGRFSALARSGIDNARYTVTSPDAAFSLSIRSLIQFDYGYFSQGRNPPGVDLNSGSNFRRAQIGLTGTAWKDWSYNFTYDFGGYGIEKNGFIYTAYIEYDGLKPFGFRIGDFAPPAGIEDSTGSADLIFPERTSAVDIARNIAGAPGREAASIFVQGATYLVSLAYTGKKANDPAITFDAQQALVGRASWLAINNKEVKWLLDAHFTHVLRVADIAPNSTSANTFSFSNGPEVAVDASKTVNTGNIDANHVTEFGFETAGTYAGLYAQGGWFHYNIARKTALPNSNFQGWYAVLTYSLTGEEHVYDPVSASFRGLKPSKPLSFSDGTGAWEMKARYSVIDLDFMPFNSAATGGVGGGKQDIWTVGVNWYPTNGIRFAFDYDNIQVNHINAPSTDVSANAFVVRTQVSF